MGRVSDSAQLQEYFSEANGVLKAKLHLKGVPLPVEWTLPCLATEEEGSGEAGAGAVSELCSLQLEM